MKSVCGLSEVALWIYSFDGGKKGELNAITQHLKILNLIKIKPYISICVQNKPPLFRRLAC